MRDKVKAAVDQIGSALLGKEHEIRLALCCLLSGGHLLIEDLPGMGKTTLAQALAKVFGLKFSRIQFTSDLLPADILGVSIFDGKTSAFHFHPGPIFSQLVLADEINRATPKTQSALLEAMEEGQVSVEGATRALPQPFFVIATQNPVTLAGTFPLPESQLDRFLMRLKIGYPDSSAERRLLETTEHGSVALEGIKQCFGEEELALMRQAAARVSCSKHLLDYVQRLIACTRDENHFDCGLSPRGSIALVRTARTWAFMQGREHVIPEDVQTVFTVVVEHRLQLGRKSQAQTGDTFSQWILQQVDVFNS
ncbi:MAG: AAA family ATPase [Pseudomonadales bacterium]|nr:AAA family ATPase [Pseudomonadales bacterium]